MKNIERIALQVELKKFKRFIQEFPEYIEDRIDFLNTRNEETVPIDEVIDKFEELNGESL